jgi:hypothetical protein
VAFRTRNSGAAEVIRLQTEISEGPRALQDRVENFAKGLSSEQCRIYLSKMVKGEFDFKNKYPNEVKLLMGN